jgi:hypothetical protein
MALTQFLLKFLSFLFSSFLNSLHYDSCLFRCLHTVQWRPHFWHDFEACDVDCLTRIHVLHKLMLVVYHLLHFTVMHSRNKDVI